MAFSDGIVPTTFVEGTLVLVPKSKPGEYRGIALLDCLYKLVSCIVNKRLQNGITFDDGVHGFRRHRGTGTAVIEAKLQMQLHYRNGTPLYMVFLDISKAYDSLDRGRTLETLRLYGVGPNIIRLISTIWRNDKLVPRQSGYFGRPFDTTRGVRQGDIISPMIFNIVIDAVLRSWRRWKLIAIEGEHNNNDNLFLESQFYADDGMISGTNADMIQRSLDFYSSAFKAFGLQVSHKKTEYMILTGPEFNNRVCKAAYEKMNLGEGLSYKERTRLKVPCEECGEIISNGAMKRHKESAKCKRNRNNFRPSTPVRREIEENNLQWRGPRNPPATYNISIPNECTEQIPCPVPHCIYKVNIPIMRSISQGRAKMRDHFRNRHPGDKIIITEEGPLPTCQLCGLTGKTVLQERHRNTQQCKRYTERRKQYFKKEENERARNQRFTIDGNEIKRTNKFKYLGRVLHEDDDDRHVMNRQLQRAISCWNGINKILIQQNISMRDRKIFFITIVQAVLLYGSESWTLSTKNISKLAAFHHRVARQLTGKQITKHRDGTWTFPGTDEVLREAGLLKIEEYITKRRSRLGRHVANNITLERCRTSCPAFRNTNRITWWDLHGSQLGA